MILPTAVRGTPRPSRMNRRWPTSCSSAASCCDTADGVRCRAAAAAVTVPWSATAWKVRSRRVSITPRGYAPRVSAARPDERVDRGVHVLLRVGGRELDADAGLAVRHHRVREPDHV